MSWATDKCAPFFKVLTGKKRFQWTDECEKAITDLKQYLGSPPLLSKSLCGETLYVYLAVSDSAVSAVLICQEGRTQLPVYYVSHSLVSAETQYPAKEKLALALLMAAHKLKPYF